MNLQLSGKCWYNNITCGSGQDLVAVESSSPRITSIQDHIIRECCLSRYQLANLHHTSRRIRLKGQVVKDVRLGCKRCKENLVDVQDRQHYACTFKPKKKSLQCIFTYDSSQHLGVHIYILRLCCIVDDFFCLITWLLLNNVLMMLGEIRC